MHFVANGWNLNIWWAETQFADIFGTLSKRQFNAKIYDVLHSQINLQAFHQIFAKKMLFRS